MKTTSFLIFLIVLLSCNSASNKKNSASGDTTVVDNTNSKIDSSESNPNLMELNKKILTAIKKKEYQSIARYVHPQLGLRFSPYATVDLNNDAIFQAVELIKIMKDDTKLFWGNYDGTGDPIDLSAKDYFAQFVYDADFLKAEKVMINRSSAQGNSINNINSVYRGCEYVENYFSGFDKKYDGMDWRALRLVFQKEGDRYYLVGIVHDQWTI